MEPAKQQLSAQLGSALTSGGLPRIAAALRPRH
ncbi:hypothetical protein METH_14085 [Leisingera methylohalidivorans DSM 14336]|uniref:Uncharacterized protein n=1 Tax=Leisingera methylohalidivorans DSM 14336 TaxID=999552 RepID=V9VWJ4_9RHOB|nr:hypothetical protein METH_14085 [Leisingera methylohalidivorans DSM 14336]